MPTGEDRRRESTVPPKATIRHLPPTTTPRQPSGQRLQVALSGLSLDTDSLRPVRVRSGAVLNPDPWRQMTPDP